MQRTDEVAAQFAAARTAGDYDVLPVIAGEAAGLVHDIVPAAQVVQRTVADAAAALASATRRFALA